MDKNCPSRINAVLLENGQINVHFVSTHVGHDHSPQISCLTNQQKKVIADQISLGIPNQLILAYYTNSINNDSDKKMEIRKINRRNLEKSIEGIWKTLKNNLIVRMNLKSQILNLLKELLLKLM